MRIDLTKNLEVVFFVLITGVLFGCSTENQRTDETINSRMVQDSLQVELKHAKEVKLAYSEFYKILVDLENSIRSDSVDIALQQIMFNQFVVGVYSDAYGDSIFELEKEINDVVETIGKDKEH